ncbi:hypothetical protein AMTRI_Chr12g238750 [Amborella trichopoda]
MKLRLRSLESKETIKIETPPFPCSLQALKTAIAESLGTSPASLHLSLNKKDELDGPPNALIDSYGVTSGDLIFYTLNPVGFSQSMENSAAYSSFCSSSLVDAHIQVGTPIFDEDIVVAGNPSFISEPNSDKDFIVEEEPISLSNSNSTFVNSDEEKPGFDDAMAVDDETVLGKSLSVPCFLRRVLSEMDHKALDGHGLLILAVHAVMLETGFVGLDPQTNRQIDGCSIPEGWASRISVSLRYTVPELLNRTDGVESVVLKFHILGKFVLLYGSLCNGSSDIYRLSLYVTQFLPAIFALSKSGSKGSSFEETGELGCSKLSHEREGLGSLKSSYEREVFQLWKIVKDQLSLPLLTALCEKTGLPPPPCLLCIPTELKLKVLELLSPPDISKLGCVCSELRYVSSNDDIWKAKFVEEFGPLKNERALTERSWKERYLVCFERNKRKIQFRRRVRPFGSLFPQRRRSPAPFGGPGHMIIGGDYDMFPPIGNSVLFGTNRGFPRFRARDSFITHCNRRGSGV